MWQARVTFKANKQPNAIYGKKTPMVYIIIKVCKDLFVSCAKSLCQ